MELQNAQLGRRSANLCRWYPSQVNPLSICSHAQVIAALRLAFKVSASASNSVMGGSGIASGS